MKMLGTLLALTVLGAVAAAAGSARAQDEPPQENHCLSCHGERDLWDQETLHLYVDAEELATDVHWRQGIRCHDCHGGDPSTLELRQAHALEDGFRKIESPADVPDFCGRCHSDARYMQRFQPELPTDQAARFWSSVHGRRLKETGGDDAPTCTSCHPKHAIRPATDPESSISSRRLVETCGQCHREQLVDLRKSVHHKAGEKNEAGAGTLLDCGNCHGVDAHAIVAVKDPGSPVLLEHQVEVCGTCHEKHRNTYERSVHGLGLRESGLVVTAVCADCHGAHGIYYAADRRSTLHAANVAATCGACHYFVEEKLEASVHGRGAGPGSLAPHAAPGGKQRRKPSCTDCHQRHDQPDPASTAFQLQLPNRCGNCHPDYSQRYRMSLHGQLTELGYEPAAKCSDCHGAHDILPVAEPSSRLAPGHRLATCRRCHVAATANFTGFDPHADAGNAQQYPLLHRFCSWTKTLLLLLIGFFAIHALFWFTRSFAHAIRHGRHRRLMPHQRAVIRFEPAQRYLYLLLMASFLGLVLTGLPLRYSGYAWARRVADALGGFETTRIWHHFCAVALLGSCVGHLVRAGGQVWARRKQRGAWITALFGPDSVAPNWRDLKDLRGMAHWFLGAGSKPTFERWTYWEKFDYWAVFLGVIVIGASGLMLWLPNVFCQILPGEALNVAKAIHADLALAIAGVVFVIHVFNIHMRPEKFPMDSSLFTGLVNEEHLRSARPEFLERMRREGRLDGMLTVVPGGRRLRPVVWMGFLILAAGMALAATILLAALGR